MNSIWQILSQSLPSQSRYTVNDVPDLAGKVIIVTGGNTGIGKITCKELLAHNATVFIAGRNQRRIETAIEELHVKTGKTAHFLRVDLADLASVRSAAQEFQKRETALHVLINNAGVMGPPVDQISVDGYDLQFGTNVLGHFYFTKLLLPLLINTASTSGEKTRVVNLSSLAHYLLPLDFDSFKDGPRRRRQWSIFLYCQSKYGNLLFAQELARRYGDQGIVSTAVNPGNLKTELGRHLHFVIDYIMSLFLYKAEFGALSSLRAATAPEGVDFNGQYLRPWARIGEPRSNDAELGKELWTWMEEQIQQFEAKS